MRLILTIACSVAACASSATANAQFTTANTAPSRAAVTTANGGSSGVFLGGSDDCAAAHTNAGTGDLFGVPFSTGSTGTAGQNEVGCYFFGTTGVDRDVWYDWTADTTGTASLTSCAGTSVDTRVVAWPGTPGACPTDGTSLACNDVACAFQSTMTWSVTFGSTYTLQVGTFPGASGGTGTWDISQAVPPPCGTYDDGDTETALGLTAGGETGWMHDFDCINTIDMIETAYGSAPGANPPNGNGSRIVAYEDPDCTGDATNTLTLMWSTTTTTVNVGTDLFAAFPFPGMGTNTAGSGCTFVMATGDNIGGEFPAPMDETNPTPNAWVVGSTLGAGTMDITNLNNNNVPPLQMQAIGFPSAWLLRASGNDVPSGYPQSCFGGTGCPCGNDGDGLGGCESTVGLGGGTLAGRGSAIVGASDTLVLEATRVTNQPGIFFQGNDALVPAPTFGDGLRCCGNSVVRIGTYLPSGNAIDTATGNLIGGVGPPISQHPGNAGLVPGDTRCYQWWYRDSTGPCNGSFNLSNAISATWL